MNCEERKKEEEKREEKKKSFFSQAQLESIRKSEEDIEKKEGSVLSKFTFDRGYLSPDFVTEAGCMETILENVNILITDKKLSAMNDLLPVLEKNSHIGKPILVIANDVEGKALETLVVNKLRGTVKCAAVKAPSFGDRRKEILKDIAVFTAGQVISEELGVKLENADINMLGNAKRVIVNDENTTIIGGAGNKKDIDARIKQIITQIEETDSDYDREKLEERLAELAGIEARIKLEERLAKLTKLKLVIDYINANKEMYSKEKLKIALMKTEWTKAEIDAAFRIVESQEAKRKE